MSDAFQTTRWTRVLAARGDSTLAGEAMRSLCADCYAPVLAFLRRGGHTADEAADLAHGFFEWVLTRDPFAAADPERGRFRSYLLGALKHYLSRERVRASRQKRGGGQNAVELPADGELADARTLPPDREFDRQWALHLLRRALSALETECSLEGGAEEFARLRPFLTGDAAHGGLAALAQALGVPEPSLRGRLHKLRRRFRRHVREAVAPTLTGEDGVEDEMSALLAALSSS